MYCTSSLSEHGNFTAFSACKGEHNERLSYLHSICDMRLREAATSPYRMKEICDQIPLALEGLHLDAAGYHQNCYKRFTRNLGCLQAASEVSTSGASSSTSLIKDSLRKHKSQSALIHSEGARCSFLFPEQCIFCDKIEIEIKGKTERFTKFQSWKHKEPAWKVIEPRALELKKDTLYRNVQGKDLFAMEAKYHPSCRNTFNTEYQNHMRDREIRNPLLAQKKEANQKSYLVVKDYILRNVIDGKEVVQLSFLCSLFNKDLVSQGFPNPDYRNERLMRRLQADEDISHKLAFCKVPHRGCVELYLVYSSSISVAEAVSCAYKLGTADQLHDAALTLHALSF